LALALQPGADDGAAGIERRRQAVVAKDGFSAEGLDPVLFFA